LSQYSTKIVKLSEKLENFIKTFVKKKLSIILKDIFK
jgi:hypothetical protein